jgi:hypothetical protein
MKKKELLGIFLGELELKVKFELSRQEYDP